MQLAGVIVILAAIVLYYASAGAQWQVKRRRKISKRKYDWWELPLKHVSYRKVLWCGNACLMVAGLLDAVLKWGVKQPTITTYIQGLLPAYWVGIVIMLVVAAGAWLANGVKGQSSFTIGIILGHLFWT